jgi:hypothetical protein
MQLLIMRIINKRMMIMCIINKIILICTRANALVQAALPPLFRMRLLIMHIINKRMLIMHSGCRPRAGGSAAIPQNASFDNVHHQ